MSPVDSPVTVLAAPAGAEPAGAAPAGAATAGAEPAGAAPAAGGPGAGGSAPAPAPVRTLRPGPVSLAVEGFWSWTLIDRRTGETAGSPNATERSDTASMVKPWIAADFLRRAAQPVNATDLENLSLMIRDSDNKRADTYLARNGGTRASIGRMITVCGLTGSRVVTSGSWSTTEVSARDGARLAVCLADGRAAGPQWTDWLLRQMRGVRGPGRFGIVAAFPDDVGKTVAMKNGWIDRDDGNWHIACLAVTGDWALSVLARYPVRHGMGYGADTCRQVAAQLGRAE